MDIRTIETSEIDVPESKLIERFVVNKDQQAFTTLVLRFQNQLRKYATRLCDGDSHIAEDLVQETFLRAFLALANFRGESKLSTWLHSITFNLAMRNYRKHRLQPKQWCQLEDIAELEDSAQPLEQYEVERDLAKAMGNISPPQQNVIYLCVFDGYSHEQVAEATGMPLGTVKTNVRRGKYKLKEFLSAWSEAA